MWSSLKYAVQNSNTTKTKAPTILPKVTGNKLLNKQDFNVRCESCSVVKPEAATTAGVCLRINRLLRSTY